MVRHQTHRGDGNLFGRVLLRDRASDAGLAEPIDALPTGAGNPDSLRARATRDDTANIDLTSVI